MYIRLSDNIYVSIITKRVGETRIYMFTRIDTSDRNIQEQIAVTECILTNSNLDSARILYVQNISMYNIHVC